MAKIIPIGEPANDDERRAIAFLRDRLPDTYFIPHNFEVVRDCETFEVDIAVIAPHAVYLADVKDTRGSSRSMGPSGTTRWARIDWRSCAEIEESLRRPEVPLGP